MAHLRWRFWFPGIPQTWRQYPKYHLICPALPNLPKDFFLDLVLFQLIISPNIILSNFENRPPDIDRSRRDKVIHYYFVCVQAQVEASSLSRDTLHTVPLSCSSESSDSALMSLGIKIYKFINLNRQFNLYFQLYYFCLRRIACRYT